MVEVGGPQSGVLRFWWTSALQLTGFTVSRSLMCLMVDLSKEPVRLMMDLVYLLLGERFYLCFVSLKIDSPGLVWLEDKAHHIVSGVIFNGVVNDYSCILP